MDIGTGEPEPGTGPPDVGMGGPGTGPHSGTPARGMIRDMGRDLRTVMGSGD